MELDCTEAESLRKLRVGALDALVTLDTFGDAEAAVPLCKIGSSDYYFAVNKDRPDLLSDLNQAMSKIQDENRYYNWQLYEKYLRNAASTSYLDQVETAWLSAHGTIRVGYQDNYLAFCASDGHGELTGALKDYLEIASKCLKNAELSFEAVAYPTAAEATEAPSKEERWTAYSPPI